MDVIKQTIVVEGRDDRSAVERAVSAPILETHGFGIRAEKWKELEAAYARTGLIIFTDPDFSGEKIRARLAERFPNALHAYLTAPEAERDGDIGIENASPEAIAEALHKAHGIVRAMNHGESVRIAKFVRTAESGSETNPSSAFAGECVDSEFTIDNTRTFTMDDLFPFSGGPDAAERRRQLGSILGIGYSNAKTLLKKLNRMGISREEFEAACSKIL